MNETIEQIKKMKLVRREDQELKIFFMIGKRPLPPQPEEKVIAVLAYLLEDAFQKAKASNPGFLLLFNGQTMTVRELLGKIQSEDGMITPLTHPSKQQEAKPKPPGPSEPVRAGTTEATQQEQKKINFVQFKQGLMLAADEYLEGEDQRVLKEIIGRLKEK